MAVGAAAVAAAVSKLVAICQAVVIAVLPAKRSRPLPAFANAIVTIMQCERRGSHTVQGEVSAKLVQIPAAVDIDVAEADERQLRAIGQPLQVIRERISWGGESDEKEEDGG